MTLPSSVELLKVAFELIEQYDKTENMTPDDYEKRTTFVYYALALAKGQRMECGIRFDVDDKNGKDWPVVVIKLPAGEVAWHCAAYPSKFDGHTYQQKYDRIHAFNGTS